MTNNLKDRLNSIKIGKYSVVELLDWLGVDNSNYIDEVKSTVGALRRGDISTKEATEILEKYL